ncbi:ankyrin repeat domain-containing protein 34B [Acanthopagrus latus]|uniref:ankyrin repeat domain-containing protein 34B n=1 Tax=Acanthopagrus latus TaxID=8177 RepID=UPI00187C1B37|nr:ankyrin repeat domain-containing protein 34B [Acanthopagrus latus]
MGDHLSDCSPLISAASSGKLRLVRLLVEGGAQVNACNPRGETALLAACRALSGEPAGPETVKLLSYLLQNKADPNVQDRAGRTALMYACMERAGAQVASTLLAAGADPSMEDHSGASALVYAVNAQHQPTLKVLMDACQARGRDIIIIATEMGVNGGPVTRRYLNVPPSPDTSPVSCMSPSDIFLRTGSPNSPEGENIFNFRGTSNRGSASSSSGSSSRLPSSELSPPPRQRVLSEPWLTIHNLACLNQAYEEGMSKRSPQDEEEDEEEEDSERDDEEGADVELHSQRRAEVQRRDDRYGGENYISCRGDFLQRVSQSVLSLTEMSSSQVTPTGPDPRSCVTAGGSPSDQRTQRRDSLPACLSPSSHLRRNTLPSVTVFPPLLHLPPLVNRSDSHLQVPTHRPPFKSRSMVFLPHPPSSSPPSSSSSSSSKASMRPASLPPLPLASSVTSLVAPPASSCSERSRRSPRRHSAQLEQIGGRL